MKCAISESKLSNSLDEKEWEKFNKQVEKLFYLFNKQKKNFYFKNDPIENLRVFLHQCPLEQNISVVTSDVFDPRKISPYFQSTDTTYKQGDLYKIVDYNEACHEHLYPLSESTVNLRNALRDMNGENGFFGVFRKSKRQEVEKAVNAFAKEYEAFYNHNSTMQLIYKSISKS